MNWLDLFDDNAAADREYARTYHRTQMHGPCEDDYEVTAPYVDMLPEENHREEPSPLDFGGARRFGYPAQTYAERLAKEEEGLTVTCNFCKGPAHPATGCVYGPNTISCRACTVRFWQWVKEHTNKKARRSSRGVPTALSFYEHAGRKP